MILRVPILLKILLYTDLTLDPRRLFWERDLGLLTQSFRNLGHDAWLVVHPAREFTRHPPLATRHAPVIWASPLEVRSPEWWRAQKPDLVILGLWTRPKYDPIRRAALAATPRVIERADSDGMRTASCGLLTYAKRRFDYFRDRTFGWPPGVSIPASALYSLASILATPWIEARLAQTLKLLPAVAIETPHATTLWKRLATRLGVRPDIFHSIPHPIQTEIFKPNPSIAKKNQVISVGRWESYQKNYPLLVRTLVAFLEENPSWTALVVGSGLPPTPPHSRIFFSAPLSSVHLARQMQESKILLSSSRYESFGLAAAEALACGCALVSAWNHPFSFKVPGVSRQENPRHCLSLCAQNPAPAGKAVAWTKCLAPQKVASHILRLDY
jgi:glycosyltransferase involved in cell wall biosynthesis